MAKLCFILAALCCISSFVSGASLITQDSTREVRTGSETLVQCAAVLQAGENMLLYKQGRALAMVLLRSMDSPELIPIDSDFTEYINVEYGSILNTNPPSRNVNITLTISSMDETWQATYQCQSKKESSFVDLQIVGPPSSLSVTTESEDVVVMPSPIPGSDWYIKVNVDKDDDFTLTAVGVGRPSPTTWWTRNGVQHVDSITVERDETINGTYFTASAVNTYGSYNVTLMALVEYKPREPQILQAEYYPEQGQVLIAECVFDAQPKAEVYYQKIEGTDNPIIKGQQLYINAVNLDRDVGRYQCVGNNSYGMSVGVIVIYGKPKDIRVTKDKVYGKSAVLIIQVTSATAVEFLVLANSTEDYGDETVASSIQQKIEASSNQNPPAIVQIIVLEKLKSRTTYVIRVQALNKHGVAWSEPLNITTSSEDDLRPIKPTIVQAEKPKNDAIKFSMNFILSATSLLLTAVF